MEAGLRGVLQRNPLLVGRDQGTPKGLIFSGVGKLVIGSVRLGSRLNPVELMR